MDRKTLVCLMLVLVACLFSACSDDSSDTNGDLDSIIDGDENEAPTNESFSYNCDVMQGFDFSKDKQTNIGFLTSMKIGKKKFEADISVTDPLSNSHETINVFAVLSKVFWIGGLEDPISFTAQIKEDNQNELSNLMLAYISNTEVEFGFAVYKYDDKANKYFRTLHDNETVLFGMIDKQGTNLMLSVDKDHAMEVMDPKNFQMTISIRPQEKEQEIHFATSTTGKKHKNWGYVKP